MNLTIATHYCRGEFAAAKISFSGKPASCGMESGSKDNSSSETGITAFCCEDVLAAYTVDNNYAPSEAHLNWLQGHFMQVFEKPACSFSNDKFNPSSFYANTGPPGMIMTNAVNRAEICIFQI